ncbi:MAG: hypothetical protein P4K92_02725 [Candidatus Nitrosotalea sp.]|nr:hypothetical protein [Candidatus Nitrosotalea sp.]
MSNKIVLLFTTSVILASFGVMAIPLASALITNPVDNSHVTARFEGDLKVCGNHLCAHGEKTFWDKAVWGAQNVSQGKISSTTQHGESVMQKMAGSTIGTTTSHGSQKPTMHSTMPVIGASNANMTGNVPNNK